MRTPARARTHTHARMDGRTKNVRTLERIYSHDDTCGVPDAGTNMVRSSGQQGVHTAHMEKHEAVRKLHLPARAYVSVISYTRTCRTMPGMLIGSWWRRRRRRRCAFIRANQGSRRVIRVEPKRTRCSRMLVYCITERKFNVSFHTFPTRLQRLARFKCLGLE